MNAEDDDDLSFTLPAGYRILFLHRLTYEADQSSNIRTQRKPITEDHSKGVHLLRKSNNSNKMWVVIIL